MPRLILGLLVGALVSALRAPLGLDLVQLPAAEPETAYGVRALALIAIAIMMGIMGLEKEYVIPAVTVGAAICVATSMCADMMADLKTGYLVGGRPLKQQVAQIATCWIGPGISLATVSGQGPLPRELSTYGYRWMSCSNSVDLSVCRVAITWSERTLMERRLLFSSCWNTEQ